MRAGDEPHGDVAEEGLGERALRGESQVADSEDRFRVVKPVARCACAVTEPDGPEPGAVNAVEEGARINREGGRLYLPEIVGR